MKRISLSVLLGVALAGFVSVASASRDGSGTYSKPYAAFTSGTTISSSVVNGWFNDISTEIGDSLSRSGKGGMLAPIRTTDGTVAAPSHSFTNESGTGLYRIGAGNLGVAVSGVKVVDATTAGATVTGALTVTGTTTTSTLTAAAATPLAIKTIGLQDITFQPNEVPQWGITASTGNLAGTGANQINNIADPTLAQDAATKAYVDAATAAKAYVDAVPAISNNVTAAANWTTTTAGSVKLANGLVKLIGYATPAAGAAATIGTLPAAYRPAADRFFVILDVTGGAFNGAKVAADGTVSLTAVPTEAHAYYLDNISFVAGI